MSLAIVITQCYLPGFHPTQVNAPGQPETQPEADTR